MAAEVDFALSTRTGEDGSTIVELAGELDLYRVPALTQAFQTASEGESLVIDLCEVTFLDSSTLALLVQEQRRLQATGRELVLLVSEQTPMTAFKVAGIDRILTIQPDAAGANAITL